MLSILLVRHAYLGHVVIQVLLLFLGDFVQPPLSTVIGHIVIGATQKAKQLANVSYQPCNVCALVRCANTLQPPTTSLMQEQCKGSEGREGREGREGEGRGGKGREGEGREGKGRGGKGREGKGRREGRGGEGRREGRGGEERGEEGRE